ncbi:hypothetical protein [Arenimonas daejeonensis]|uniref:hypothetical protein n=1 Tax=Arenimonas daejeonensis TaxID=370777 RepID=UPI0011BDA393|nr:hypothetical protein [Arenimonas daejeonensis]
MTLSVWIWISAAVLALLAMLAWGRRPAGRRGQGPGALRRGFALLLLLMALGLTGLGWLLRTYAWLLDDVPVATLSLVEQAPQRYRATLVPTGGVGTDYVLLGDEWQLDARVIRWTLPAQLGGVPPVYRFERLSGRYGDPKQELAAQRSVHDLRRPWDFWDFRQQWLADLPIADAHWGSAAYLPMLDGARYEVFISPRGGLVAKPADAATEALLDQAGW